MNNKEFYKNIIKLSGEVNNMTAEGRDLYKQIHAVAKKHLPPYLQAFSDYDNAFMFETLLDALKGEGFCDVSFIHDACPSMWCTNDPYARHFVKIYVEYRDQKLSEFPDMDKDKYFYFNLQREMEDQGVVEEYQTNDLFEAMYYAYKLRNELCAYQDVWVERHKVSLPSVHYADDEKPSINGYAYVVEGEELDTDYLENNVHIEINDEGKLDLMIENTWWVADDTPENRDRFERILLGWCFSEGYFDGFPMIKEGTNQ